MGLCRAAPHTHTSLNACTYIQSPGFETRYNLAYAVPQWLGLSAPGGYIRLLFVRSYIANLALANAHPLQCNLVSVLSVRVGAQTRGGLDW